MAEGQSSLNHEKREDILHFYALAQHLPIYAPEYRKISLVIA